MNEAKTVKTAAEILASAPESPTFEMNVRISFKQFETDEGETKDYVATELIDPFDDEDFRDIGIAPKWTNDRPVFNFKAKKALKTQDSIIFPVTLKVCTYKRKDDKKLVSYPGLVGKSPFDGRPMEFVVKGENNRIIFDDIARDMLGLRADPDEATA